MDRLLLKRLPRDFKSNIGRYFALMFLIALGIYVIVSMVGAADMFIFRTEENKSINMVEDGNFTVFIPLTDEELETLTDDGTVIEKAFYSDVKMQDGSILRMMRNRVSIDIVMLDEGHAAEKTDEVVLEKRYCEEHNISVGDKISLAGREFTVSGIGAAPDYEMPIKTYADAVVESSTFGLAFVTDEAYNELMTIQDDSVQAEEYVYSFRLGEGISASDFRKKIEDLDFDYEKVENKYFRETIDNALEEKYNIQDDVNKLDDGAKELYEGLGELEDNNDKLLDAVDELFDAYLETAEESLNEEGVFLGLTRENYAEKLDGLVNDINSGKTEVDNPQESVDKINSLKESLDSLTEFADGVVEYTDGVIEAADGADELSSGTGEMHDSIDELLDELFNVDLYNLTSFVTADNNVRIGAAAEDVAINKVAGLFAGIILLALFTYVISVFVINQIDGESSVIGALYALGLKKNTLLRHYITLPVILTFLGGIIGTVLGFSPIGVDNMTTDTYAYFSVPKLETVYPLYLIAYGIILPPVICIIVNVLVINKKLSQTALSLIKNEQKQSSYKQFNIRTENFIKRFRIRQTVREIRSVLTVICGVLISVILVELGLDIYVMCDAVKVSNVEDTHYNYQYLYKYPDEEVPKGGEEAYIESLSIDNDGYTLEVNIIGLNEESKYFDAVLPEGKHKAAISNSIYERFHFKDGDSFVLSDSATDSTYVFTVEGKVQYSPGFTIFMDIDSMRELFEQDDDYFNAVYSDKELDIDSGRLYSVTTKDDIERAAGIFVDRMMGMIVLIISASVIIFCVVMYLMLNVMIDRSKFSISLIKIFGFRNKEIRKLYLDGNFIIVAVGTLICIPLGKKFVDGMYPMLISNIASTMQLGYPWFLYLIAYFGIIAVYLIITKILMMKINRITPAEVLKARE